MPALETPPKEQTPESPLEIEGSRRGGDRGGRYRFFETHELITLLDEVDDERARARFREAVYLALILWMSLFLLYLFLPRWLPRRPVLIVPERNPNQLTYLDTPPDLKQLLKNRPAPAVSPRTTEAETPRPTHEPRPPEPRPGSPRQPGPQPQPQARQPLPQAPQPQQPAQQPPTQQATQQPQQQARNTPPPRPSTAPLVDSPAPAPRQPKFDTGGSAGSQIANAARSAHGGAQEQGDYGSTGRGNPGQGKAGVEVLSDTQGVNFDRYLQRLLADVRRNWIPLIPEECNSPLFKQGITGVRFTIQPDGSISAMHLDYSTHDVAIDRAAWGSIKSLGQTAPLPKEFHGPNLELRIEFRVNKDRDVQ